MKIFNWFPNKRKLSLDELNRKLLFDALQVCYTKKDIAKLKDILLYSNDYLSVEKRISFTLEIIYRERLLQYCKKHLQRSYYTTVEIKALFNNTFKYWQCDAILLHIEMNKALYLENRTDLDIFTRMANSRKDYMLNEITVIL